MISEFNIFATVFLTVTVLVFTVLYLRSLGLDKIREAVYKAFVEAEEAFEHGANDEKLSYAVDAAKTALKLAPIPEVIKVVILPFITTENLKKILSAWYQQVKFLVQK